MKTHLWQRIYQKVYRPFARRCRICREPLFSPGDKSYGAHGVCMYGVRRPNEPKRTYTC